MQQANNQMGQQLWDGTMIQQLDMNGFPVAGNVQQVFQFPTNGMNGMMNGMMGGVMVGYGPISDGAHSRASPGGMVGFAGNSMSPNTIWDQNMPIRMLSTQQALQQR